MVLLQLNTCNTCDLGQQSHSESELPPFCQACPSPNQHRDCPVRSVSPQSPHHLLSTDSSALWVTEIQPYTPLLFLKGKGSWAEQPIYYIKQPVAQSWLSKCSTAGGFTTGLLWASKKRKTYWPLGVTARTGEEMWGEAWGRKHCITPETGGREGSEQSSRQVLESAPAKGRQGNIWNKPLGNTEGSRQRAQRSLWQRQGEKKEIKLPGKAG